MHFPTTEMTHLYILFLQCEMTYNPDIHILLSYGQDVNKIETLSQFWFMTKPSQGSHK